MCDVILLCILLIVFACAHVTTSSAAAHHPPLSHQGISYIPSLSKALLDRSRAVIGDESRMHRFISKLVNGQHVKYAVLGSSIATCRGASHIDTGWTAAFHKWLELSFTECGSDLPGFRFFSSDPDYWIRRHLCNKSSVQYIDMAMFASTPQFAETCLLHKVPKDVDLVIVEYGVNDIIYPEERLRNQGGPYDPGGGSSSKLMTTSERRSLERILRALLRLPLRPAVILFEAYSYSLSKSSLHAFGLLPQDFHAVLASYYGDVQLLSVRNVIHPLIHTSTTAGGWLEDSTEEDVMRSGLFTEDLTHPSDAGHRLYADILIHYIQSLLGVRKQQQHLSGGAQWGTERPLMSQGSPPGEADEQGAVLREMGARLEDALRQGLPPPLVRGNWETRGSRCFLNEDVKPLVTRSNGFEFKDEGKVFPSGLAFHKFGYIANEHGAELRLKLDASASNPAAARDKVYVLISHLKSYVGMGTAIVTCVSGCGCDPSTINATLGFNASLTSFAHMEVTPHPECELQVKVAEGPSGTSPGNKFKLIGVVVHDAPFSPHLPYLGQQQTEHEDYVEAKIGGKMPGGFQ